MNDEVSAPAKKTSWVKMGCLGLAGAFAVLVVIGAIVGDDKAPSTSGDAGTLAVENPTENLAELPAEPENALTGPQRNAVRSAEQYISMSGFSREGLIEQLSSDYGEGYEVADATVAVDSLNVDWNEQAARSAKQYLDMTGFSCKRLIDQLSSDAGENFTVEQATYGAQQAGAC